MRRKKFVSMLLVATMAATLFAGCGNDSGKKGSSGGAKEFDAFFAVPGSEINDDNEIQKIIEEKTGVRVKETWLTGQTADEAVGTMIAGGEYPDIRRLICRLIQTLQSVCYSWQCNVLLEGSHNYR